MTLNVAFNYSGRSEIVDAVQRAIGEGIAATEITEDVIGERLYTADVPPLDLLIRTGGEQRISNFLIWQAAYAELYFTDLLWPDFDAGDPGRGTDRIRPPITTFRALSAPLASDYAPAPDQRGRARAGRRHRLPASASPGFS